MDTYSWYFTIQEFLALSPYIGKTCGMDIKNALENKMSKLEWEKKWASVMFKKIQGVMGPLNNKKFRSFCLST